MTHRDDGVWQPFSHNQLDSSMPSYPGHGEWIKHYGDVTPTITLLKESLQDWYASAPKADVKVAIVTRPCNHSWMHNFGTHWGVYIDGVYIHWYGLDQSGKEWRCRHSTEKEFARDGGIVTYVLADYYHSVILQRIAEQFTPGPYHMFHNNCQHAIQKLVYGEILSTQTNALLTIMDLTRTSSQYSICVPMHK